MTWAKAVEEKENNLESILLISPVTDLSDPVSPLQGAGMQIYHSFSGCKNHSVLHGGSPLFLLFFGDFSYPRYGTALELSL
jgi:hypothetical protein